MSTQDVGRRRNGKQQACEPCRKSKQSCDHKLPHCGRCKTKSIQSQCFYHPAPMTQGYNGNTLSLETTPAPVSVSRSTSSGIKRTRSPSLQSQSATPCAKAQKGGSEGAGDEKSDVHPRRSPAQSGTTNSLKIFRDDSGIRNIYDETTDSDAVSIQGPIDAPTRSKIGAMLKSFPAKSYCYQFLGSYKALQDPLVPLPLVTAVVASIWDKFEDCISPYSRRPPKDIIEVLTNNGINPWKSITNKTFGIWPNICCGYDLRWEMLGLVYAFFGLASMQRPEDDHKFKAERMSRKEAALRMKECADICYSMWKRSGIWNDIVVNLIMAIMVLERLCSGEQFGRIRLLHCDLKYALNNRGFNKLRKLNNEEVDPATEYQRRLVMMAYELDKTIACFHGEQPELSSRYYMLQTPLDISDEVLMSDEDDLLTAIERLDKNGWNVDGKIYGITLARAKFELSKVKERVLEISLRVDIDSANKRRRIDNAATLLEETKRQFPVQLRHRNVFPVNDGPPGFGLFAQALVHLEYLNIDLCIERIRLHRKSASSQRYHDLALEMMKVIQELWNQRNGITEYHVCFDWLIINYGIPASAVLSVTAHTSLRAPLKTPYSSVPASQAMPSSQATVASVASSSGAQPRNPAMMLNVNFSLRRTINILTSFLEFMSWSRETDGNHKEIASLAKVIAKVIEVLTAGREGQGVSANNSFSSNSNSNSQPRSANSSFGGSFGGPSQGQSQGASQGNGSSNDYYPSYQPSSSALQSFEFTVSANSSIGNTQVSNPSFNGNLGEHETTQIPGTPPPLMSQAQAQELHNGIGFQPPVQGMRVDGEDVTLGTEPLDDQLLDFLSAADYSLPNDTDTYQPPCQPSSFMPKEYTYSLRDYLPASQASATGLGTGMSQDSQER